MAERLDNFASDGDTQSSTAPAGAGIALDETGEQETGEYSPYPHDYFLFLLHAAASEPPEAAA